MLVVSGILGTAALEAAAPRVPFKGNATGTITGQEVVGPTEVVLTGVSGGNATHLGTFTRTEELHLNPETGSFTGTLTFTAANGDEMACTMTGQFVSSTDAAGDYVITGGTGRFAGAAGGAAFNVSMTSETSFSVTFSGDISF
jgi:hypothetical protein